MTTASAASAAPAGGGASLNGGAPGVGALGIIGGGAWGTALAQVLAGDAAPVTLWAFEAAVVEAINRTRTNPEYLPNVALHPAITATSNLAALAGCAAILMVAPAQHVGKLMAAVPDHGQPLILCSKGMEQGTARLMAEVVSQSKSLSQPQSQPQSQTQAQSRSGWSGPVAVLSGPTFAHEVAAGQPTAVTLAARSPM